MRERKMKIKREGERGREKPFLRQHVHLTIQYYDYDVVSGVIICI